MRRVPLPLAIVVCWSVVLTAVIGAAAQSSAGAPQLPPRMMQGDTAKGTAVLKGTVVAADTGAPLRRAQVRAMAPESQDNRVAATDDQGRFELRELIGGRYTITASKGGFVTLQYGQRRPSERGTPVELTSGQTIDKLTIGLPRGGVITGRIIDDAGEPVTGARVQVLRYMFAPGGRRLLPAGQGDNSDDQGAFRIFGLTPGDYYVSAAMNSPMNFAMGPRPAGGGDDQGFAPTYYPGTPSMTEAERLTVGVGQEVGGITFGLTPTRLSRVSGRVMGWTGGASTSSGFVMAMPEDGMMGGGPPAGAQVQSDGTFEMTGVPPGRYVLRVQPRGDLDADERVGMVSVTVAGADLANVTIALQPPGSLRGRVEFEGGVPPTVRASQVRIMSMPAEPSSMRGMVGRPPEVADDFTFQMRGLGSVFVRANAPAGWYLKSVVVDGQDMTDTPVPLGPGVNQSGARVVLTQVVTHLSGSVRDDRGNVVLDATVVVFPGDETQWSFGSRYLRTARPDIAGRFELTALPPSRDYRILAVQGLEDGQASDPAFLAGARDRAERLSLNEGETKVVDVRLR